MKRQLFFVLVICGTFFHSHKNQAQVLTQDSLALVALYNSTDGPNWTNNTNWLTGPVDTWFGVTVSNQRVTEVNLNNNNLIGFLDTSIGNLEALTSLYLFTNRIEGTIPQEIGNLTNLSLLLLNDNAFTGEIPSTIGNLTSLTQLWLNANGLIGAVPSSLTNIGSLDFLMLRINSLEDLPDLSSLTITNEFDVSNNKFDFTDLIPNTSIITTNTGQLVGQNQTIVVQEGGSAGLAHTFGTDVNDTYQWYLNGSPIPGANILTYNIGPIGAGDFGSYTLEITNTTVPGLTINSETISLIGGIEVSGNITANETWTTGNIYVLNGPVFVEPGVTLTIEPGVIVKGAPGVDTLASYLVIARGALIDAQGTETEPIIFTSTEDQIQPGQLVSPNLTENDKGLWGGLLILGNAPISAAAAEIQIEGIPGTNNLGLYGGASENESSGILSYISIRHAGVNIGEGNTINGLTLAAVGNATTVNNIEIAAGFDDGIELFGGSVNVTNALVWNSGDDALDTDQDYQGTVDNFITITPSGSAFELDGPEGPSARSGGFHTFTNGSVKAGPTIVSLVDWDGTTNGGVSNIYFFGIEPGYISGIQSYLGDGSAPSDNWEATIPGGSLLTDIFTEGSDAITTEVAQGANTVGANSVAFADWTWAANVGALIDFGVDPPAQTFNLETDSLALNVVKLRSYSFRISNFVSSS